MKRILKPVGQCLTTIVMTSAVLDIYPVATAEATNQTSPPINPVNAAQAATPQTVPAPIAPAASAVATPERSPTVERSSRTTTRQTRASRRANNSGDATQRPTATPTPAATGSSQPSTAPTPAESTAIATPATPPSSSPISPAIPRFQGINPTNQNAATATAHSAEQPATQPQNPAAEEPTSAAPEAVQSTLEAAEEGDRPNAEARPTNSTASPADQNRTLRTPQPQATESATEATVEPAAATPTNSAESIPETAETSGESESSVETVAEPTLIEPGRTINFVNLGRLETAKQEASDRRSQTASTPASSGVPAEADSPTVAASRASNRVGRWTSPAVLACLPQRSVDQASRPVSQGRGTIPLPPAPQLIRLTPTSQISSAVRSTPQTGTPTGTSTARTSLQPLIPSSLQFNVAAPANGRSLTALTAEGRSQAGQPQAGQSGSASITYLPSIDQALVSLQPNTGVNAIGQLPSIASTADTPSLAAVLDQRSAAAEVGAQGKRIVSNTLSHWLNQAGIAHPMALPILLESTLDGLTGTRSLLSIDPLSGQPVQASTGFARLDLSANSALQNLKLAQVGQKLPSLKTATQAIAASPVKVAAPELPPVVVPAIATPTAAVPPPPVNPATPRATLVAAAGDCAEVSQAIAAQVSTSQVFDWSGMVFPLAMRAPVTSGFGWRVHPISGDRRFHAGVDFGAPQGTPILAAVGGQVVAAEYMGGYGLTVIVENPQLRQRNLYAHMSAIAVRPGDRIEQGSVLGLVGNTGNSTGPHLHFEFQTQTADGWVAIDPLAVAAQLSRQRTLAANVEDENSVAR